jgi:hypothetical protein
LGRCPFDRHLYMGIFTKPLRVFQLSLNGVRGKNLTYRTDNDVRRIILFRTESGGSSSNAYEINWESRETHIAGVLLLWERPETSAMCACYMRFAEASTFALLAGYLSRRCKTKAPAILAYGVCTGDASSFTTRTRCTTLGMIGNLSISSFFCHALLRWVVRCSICESCSCLLIISCAGMNRESFQSYCQR